MKIIFFDSCKNVGRWECINVGLVGKVIIDVEAQRKMTRTRVNRSKELCLLFL